MIYLIDDKTNRQEDFGWNENIIESYTDVLVSISRYNQIEEIELRKLMFSDNNIILFHESFFDNIENKQNKDVNEIRNDLIKNTKEKQNFKVIFFSGSYNSREINETGGSMPVSILYQNLAFFLNNYIETETTELKFLFFGKNPEIENILIHKRETANSLLIEELRNGNINSSNNNLIVSGNGQGFSNPFNNSINYTIFNKNVNDKELSIKLYDWFSEKEFDNIFIPLCFGPTLSDYNGLRLAMHIRCTNTKNQLKPIFIYSFVKYSYLLENEYFDILKTKNIFLIDYSKKAFDDAINTSNSPLTIEYLPKELKKINIQIPANYEDNHSIANEWAIHKWSHTINANDDSIDKINEVQNSNLFFKHLKTIYPLNFSDKLTSKQLKINYSGNPKVLYIDDEAEKGWYEIFCKILDDENNLFFRHLDVEFNEKSKEEIIEISLNKIIEEDIDLVILDFRLHKDDFQNNSIEEVTGYQILKKIKEYNKGIQVVVFSATNKIWNLQALQEAGADGFILKESPESPINKTIKTIQNYVLLIQDRLQYCFEKQLFSKCNSIKINLQVDLIAENIEYNKLINGLRKQLVIITSSIEKIDLKRKITLDIVYLSCYNFLELFKEYYLKEGNDYRYYIGFEEIELNRFSISLNLNNVEKQGGFIRNNLNDQPSWFNTIAALFIDYFEVSLSPFNDVIKLKRIANKRNEYIHGDKLSFDKNELLMIIEALDLSTKKIKE